MRKSNFALRLQPSLLEELRGVAEAEDTTLNQFINVAVAEKLAALRTEAYFRERAARADIPGALKVLDQLGIGNAPLPGDTVPELSQKKRQTTPVRKGGQSIKVIDEHELSEFAEAIGASPLRRPPGGARSTNYYRVPEGTLYIKISRSKKPFWDFSQASKDKLDRQGAWYLVLLISCKEGTVFSHEEVQSFIDRHQWRLRRKDKQYKIKSPLPNGGANRFSSPEQFSEKIRHIEDARSSRRNS